MGIALCAASSTFAGSADSASATTASSSPFSNIESGVKQWWNGNSALANWGGLGYPLADHGFSVTGEAKEAYFGLLTGGLPNQNKSNWAGEVRLKGLLDFEKLCGIQGLSFESNWRYRQINGQQDTPSTAYAAGTVGVASGFNPNHMSSGLGMRILTQFFQWQNEKGKDPRFMIKLGWVNPYQDFLQQPLSKLFENNMIESNKGIGGANGPGINFYNSVTKKYVTYSTSGVPWSSSYASWGGSLRAKPSASTYVQSGLYMAISGASGTQNSAYAPTDVYPYKATPASYLGTMKGAPFQYTGNTVGGYNQQINSRTTQGYVQAANNNHGFNFSGAKAFKPNGQGGAYSQNGLYNVNEFGWTPKMGKDRLEGKYAIGGYIWGLNNTSYSGAQYVPGQTKQIAQQNNSCNWGLYLQADQRLTTVKEAAPAAPSMGKNPVDSKNPAPAATTTNSKTRGLYSFSMFNYTPPQNCALPYYFQVGLVYKGLLDIRKEDQMGVVLGSGFYSSYYNQYINGQNKALQNNYGNGTYYNGVVPNGPGYYGKVNATTGATGAATNAAYKYAPNYTSTQVVEAFYQFQLNKWLTFKPFAEWLINPCGNGTVANDLILGASVKALF